MLNKTRLMLSINKCLLSIPVLFLFCALNAQEKEQQAGTQTTALQLQAIKVASGYIKDAVTGKGIGSARVTYKDIYAAITDSAGKFSIKVPNYNVAVRVEAEGYQAKDVALKGASHVSASLYESDYTSFYDDVTNPFAVVPKSQLTTAAVSVQTKGAWGNIAETPDAYLQGRVAGLNAIRRSGTSNIGANLFLRGYSSLFATNQPLVIVDGVFFDVSNYGGSLIEGYYNNPLAFIDLKDIDNITVLKDGSSIYGTKGANGVVLITTARARQQATKIDVGLYGGINTMPTKIPVMNTSDYRTYLSEMLQSKGLSYKEMQALPYMNDDQANPDYYRNHYNNNWQDKIFSNNYSQNGYMKITGGDNIARYALTMGFLKNGGVIKETDLTRYNTRFNADLNLSPKLTAATNLSFIYNEQNMKNSGTSWKTNPIYAALIKSPFFAANQVADNGVESPALAAVDTFGMSNPTAIINNMQALNKNYRFVGSVAFNYQLAKHLSLSTTLGVTIDKVRESFFVPQVGIVSDTLENAIAKNRSGVQVIRMFGLFNDTRLSYNRTFNRVHQFAARVGVRYNRTQAERDTALGFNSATDQMTGVGYGVTALRRIGGSQMEWSWMNTYLNADYGLSDKYFLSFNMAIDGSSRFGTDARGGAVLRAGDRNYALLPSLSGAWLASSESFMAGVKRLDLLKLRASVGFSGNDDIGNYASRKYYVTQNLLGIVGLVRGNVGNPSLQWEEVTKLNAGLDVALLNERVSLSFDAYQNKTDKMLVFEPAPAFSGLDYTISNSGAMKTTGWEASVNARIVYHNKLKWDLGFNIAQYKSKVTKLPMNAILTPFAGGTILTQEGRAPNLFYGYKTAGVYTSDAEAAAAGLSNKNQDGSTTAFSGGDIHFVDNSGVDKVVDDNDRQVIGNPNPDFFGGITNKVVWKNWTLDALLTFSQGNDVYNYTRRQLESMSGYANQTEAVKNRWKTNGQITDIPKASWGDPLGNSRFSDRWVEDGSYLRLKTVSLAYNIPFKPGAIKYITVYLTGHNVLTLTKYLGYDPEYGAAAGLLGQGVDAMLEPQYRSGQVGIKLGL